MTDASYKPARKIVGFQPRGLDVKGYGPLGRYTRGEWRQECSDNLRTGANTFKKWQEDWMGQVQNDQPPVQHSGDVTFDDGLSMLFNVNPQPAHALDFVGNTFADPVDLKSFEFLFPALFNGVKFERGINLTYAIFSCDACFSCAEIYGNAYFKSVLFGGKTDFLDVRFTSYAYFNNAVFNQDVNFSRTTFGGDVDFDCATFAIDADFNEVTVARNMSFRHAIFRRDAYFNNVSIKGNAHFNSSEFNRDAHFTKTVFHNQCRFNNLVNVDTSGLGTETRFSGVVDFESVIFKSVGHFERVRFVGQVPSFLGVDTAATRLEFSGASYFPKNDRTQDAVNRLGHLKRLADEHGQTDQAIDFNALELSAKAGLGTTCSFTKLVTLVYGAASDYGRSFARPLAAYVALLFTTLLLAAGHAAFSLPAIACDGASWWILSDLRRTSAPCAPVVDDKLHISGYRAAAEYTLYRAAGVLDFSDNGKATDAVARRLFSQPIEPWWMRVWGVFKAIASTALLFLTALGLRNKYRIK